MKKILLSLSFLAMSGCSAIANNSVDFSCESDKVVYKVKYTDGLGVVKLEDEVKVNGKTIECNTVIPSNN